MKKITLLLLALGIFTAFGFTILQGGNDPIPAIDIIIIKEDPSSQPIMNLSMDDTSLKELSALADEERSIYLSKYLAPIFEKVTRDKGLEKAILRGLLQNRCIECKSFETFTFKVPSNYKKNGYVVTFNIKFDTKWITVITNRDNFEKPIANPHNFKLIDKVNELESKLKPQEIKELVKNFTKKDVYRIDLSMVTTKEEVFKNYIEYFDDQDRLSRKN